MAKGKQEATRTKENYYTLSNLLLAFFFIVYAFVFLARQVNLITADLGRHLTNGKIFVQTGNIISTNYYSYTQPDYPAINHHWGSGVVFYFVQQYFGFEGLTLFYVLLTVTAVLLFIAVALRYADARLVFFLAVIAMPLIASRTEVRPEGISVFFISVFFYTLVLFRENKFRFIASLVLLGITQLLWVNAHIFFFMGFMLTGFFLAEEFFTRQDKTKLKHYLILLVTLIAVSLINPFFVQGFLVPFTIFKEYGYSISENQTVFFMARKFDFPLYTHVQIQAVFLLLLIGLMAVQKKLKQSLFLLFPLIAFGILGFKAVRAIPLFALFAIPAAAYWLQQLLALTGTGIKKIGLNVLAFIAGVIIPVSFAKGYSTYTENKIPGAAYTEPVYFSPIKYTTGIGLVPDINKSAEFFLSNHIKGPVFNDYDIGGYLIYHLYGNQKVFVDNRPEAYSVAFFQQTYIPMQEEIEKFREEEAKYQFNCIWFYMGEDSPWSHRFLWQIMKQSDYAPVFCDGLTIIFLKRNSQNASVIARNEIPKSRFHSAAR